MCACRIEEIRRDPHSLYDLVEFVTEMEGRTNDSGVESNGELTMGDQDIYSQLARKDRDLILAAELGKALLEQNEELNRNNSRLTDEFTERLEQLEQDNYRLRRKIGSLEGEYESRVAEMQGDLEILRKELEDQNLTTRSSEKEQSSLIHELTEQNHRLTSQLKQVSTTEEQLSFQLQHLRQQFQNRKSSIQDHVSQMEMLREEINLITEKKAELESRIQVLMEEREGIVNNFHGSSEKIQMLEVVNREQEQTIRLQERDLEELRFTNTHLQSRVEVLSRRSGSGSPPSLSHTSLLNELEFSDGALNSDLKKPYDIDDEDVECDDDVILHVSENAELQWLRQEATEVYKRLRELCSQLRRNLTDSTSHNNNNKVVSVEERIRPGLLLGIVQELFEALKEIQLTFEHEVCLTCGNSPPYETGDKDSLCRNLEMTREELMHTRRMLSQKGEDLRQRGEEVYHLHTKLAVLEVELNSLKEERDILRNDLANSHMSRDEVVQEARGVRDKALAAKKSTQMELAKTRIDFMAVNGQLIEVVQQKLELSQQLEQWQVDMHNLLDAQVRKRLNQQEKEELLSVGPIAETQDGGSPRKLFGLWR